MARGESQRATGNPMGAAVLAIFAASALGALAFVVVTTRACSSCEAALYGGMASTDPYVGASTAAAELGWRDAARARAAYGSPLNTDPLAAARAIEALLLARGYVMAERMTVASAAELPMQVPVPDLGGACGVLEVIGEPGTRIDRGLTLGADIGASTDVRATQAADPSVMTIGACGDEPIRVEGIGRATARVWLLPGLTPRDVELSGLPPDVLLAHAEAEHRLARYGYLPTGDIVRAEITGTGSPSVMPALPLPPSGCAPWVVVALGAGNATTGAWSDRAPDRALSLAVTCAGAAGWDVALTAEPGVRATTWARAYRPPGSGAALPSDAPTTIGASRVATDPAALIPPVGLPEVH